MQIASYVTPNIFIIVQKSPKSLAAGAPPQTPPDPLAALGWDRDFKTLYPRQEILGTRLIVLGTIIFKILARKNVPPMLVIMIDSLIIK